MFKPIHCVLLLTENKDVWIMQWFPSSSEELLLFGAFLAQFYFIHQGIQLKLKEVQLDFFFPRFCVYISIHYFTLSVFTLKSINNKRLQISYMRESF